MTPNGLHSTRGCPQGAAFPTAEAERRAYAQNGISPEPRWPATSRRSSGSVVPPPTNMARQKPMVADGFGSIRSCEAVTGGHAPANEQPAIGGLPLSDERPSLWEAAQKDDRKLRCLEWRRGAGVAPENGFGQASLFARLQASGHGRGDSHGARMRSPRLARSRYYVPALQSAIGGVQRQLALQIWRHGLSLELSRGSPARPPVPARSWPPKPGIAGTVFHGRPPPEW